MHIPVARQMLISAVHMSLSSLLLILNRSPMFHQCRCEFSRIRPGVLQLRLPEAFSSLHLFQLCWSRHTLAPTVGICWVMLAQCFLYSRSLASASCHTCRWFRLQLFTCLLRDFYHFLIINLPHHVGLSSDQSSSEIHMFSFAKFICSAFLSVCLCYLLQWIGSSDDPTAASKAHVSLMYYFLFCVQIFWISVCLWSMLNFSEFHVSYFTKKQYSCWSSSNPPSSPPPYFCNFHSASVPVVPPNPRQQIHVSI